MGRSSLDLGRVAAVALEAALDDGSHRHRRFSRLGAVATGAALAAAARVAVSRAPGLPRLPDLAEVGHRIHDRLADRGWIGDEDEVVDDDEPRDEGDQDVDDDEPPRDEGDQDVDDEDEDEDEDDLADDEEPRDEADQDVDDDESRD